MYRKFNTFNDEGEKKILPQIEYIYVCIILMILIIFS